MRWSIPNGGKVIFYPTVTEARGENSYYPHACAEEYVELTYRGHGNHVNQNARDTVANIRSIQREGMCDQYRRTERITCGIAILSR